MTELTRENHEKVLTALHALILLHFRHWPLTEEDKRIPFVKNIILPILPETEEFHKLLHPYDLPTRVWTTEGFCHFESLSEENWLENQRLREENERLNKHFKRAIESPEELERLRAFAMIHGFYGPMRWTDSSGKDELAAKTL
jgi:hypothetical protein